MTGKTQQSPRDRMIDATLSLAGEKAWSDVSMADIAARAGLSLGEAAALFPGGKGMIIAAFARRVDSQLLASLESDPVDGSAHDRLFEIIMRRLEIMQPWKAAIAGLAAARAPSPVEGVRLVASVMRSQSWHLRAAGIDPEGPEAVVKTAGLAAVYVRVVRVWVNDDDPGKAKTMAVLDRALRRGGEWLRRAEAPLALCVAVRGLVRAVCRARANAKRTGRAGEGEGPATEAPSP